MGNELLNIAEDLIGEGINVVAVSNDKKPLHKWTNLQKVMMGMEFAEEFFKRAHGVAVICGKISGNLECIDFDAHNNDIQKIYDEWASDEGVVNILNRNKVYTERSKRGGIHVLYRYDAGAKAAESEKLANWEDGSSMIETRGEGGYVIVAPTPGYEIIDGDLLSLPELTADERDYLIGYARNFNREVKKQKAGDEPTSVGYEHTDPISWFNWNKAAYVKNLLKEKGWTHFATEDNIEQWRRPGKSEGTSATWGNKYNAFYMFTTSWPELEPKVYYTPFQLLVKFRFKGDYMGALHWIVNKYLNVTDEMPYIRVGTDYYKRIAKADRYGLERVELKPWKKDEIKQDHGKEIFDSIPKFDDFDIQPNNFEYTPVVRNCYNLYKEFTHEPHKGKILWSERLMQHVFGDQYALGLRYMQALYLHPKRLLPILVLVSKERQTGKTTFINWLNMIFGANMVNINPEDLTSSFNSTYATSNIIAVEETLIEKSVTVEKLKALATGKFLSVNQKYVSPYKVPFFGKIILASNNEEKFARIEEEEIRFFVRKLTAPKFVNHNVEEDLLQEIPAFLHYLTTLPAIDWSRDRTGFTPEELANDQLSRVKKESKSGLYKDLVHLFTELFYNHPLEAAEIQFTPKDIKQLWFKNNSKIDIQYIAFVLRNEFKLEPSETPVRYQPFEIMVDDNGALIQKRNGRVYTLKASNFVTGKIPKDTTDLVVTPSEDVPF